MLLAIWLTNYQSLEWIGLRVFWCILANRLIFYLQRVNSGCLGCILGKTVLVAGCGRGMRF